MTMCHGASISPSTSPHKIILPRCCSWFMALRTLARPLWKWISPYGMSPWPSQEPFSISSLDTLFKALQCPLFICALPTNTAHSYPYDPHAPRRFLRPHKYAHMCILQCHKFTMKQSPRQRKHIHSPPFLLFPPPHEQQNPCTDVRRRCVYVSRSINEQRYQEWRKDGRIEWGRDRRLVGRRCLRKGVVDAALTLSHGRRDFPP